MIDTEMRLAPRFTFEIRDETGRDRVSSRQVEFETFDREAYVRLVRHTLGKCTYNNHTT